MADKAKQRGVSWYLLFSNYRVRARNVDGFKVLFLKKIETRMETARILVRSLKKILLPTPNSLKISKSGTANSPVHVTSVFSISPDICKHGGYNCNRSIFYPSCKFRQTREQLWKVNSIVHSGLRPGREMKRCEVAK